MIDFNQNDFDDNIKFQKFEPLGFSCEEESRQRPPFFPQPEDNYPPDFNFPGGVFNAPGMPKSPPPNYIPNKNSPGTQKFSTTGGASTYAVSANSIRFCLYKYTYIWERNGRNYWSFLLNVDRSSVSGFRWTGRYWIYFGVDLRRIDSFVCYRSESDENCTNCENVRIDKIEPENKKDYLRNEIKDVYKQILNYVDIPEVKEDYITRSLGLVENTDVKSEIPCVKIRNLCYRITLEVAYPNDFDENLKKELIKSAKEACNESLKIFNSKRISSDSSNSLENFNNSISLIPNALSIFANSFNSSLQILNLPPDKLNTITYSIKNEKIYNDWKSYVSAL